MNACETSHAELGLQLTMSAESPRVLYRLCRTAELAGLELDDPAARTGAYAGVAGLDDSCVHLSTSDQVRKTASLYFRGAEDLVLLRFSAARIGETPGLELRFEDAAPPPGVAARPGAFPHLYGGPVPFSALVSPPCMLCLGDDGEHIFPPGSLSDDAE